MPRRPGGLDPGEIDEALDALASVSTPEALEAALDRVPALHSPFLHAVLRQQYLQFSNAKNPQLAGFEARYRHLFLLLHERWHQRLVADARAAHAKGERAESQPGAADPYAPPFWRALRRAFDGAVPPGRGAVVDPVTGSEALVAEVRASLGREIALPPFTASAGSKWCALVVGCGCCDRRRLDVRAYAADLVVAPDLAAPVRERRINNSRCGACGGELSYPIRVWIVEQPGPGDALAALSCAWRLSPDVFSYQPPPGTPRVEENDRILEIRFDGLFRELSWPEPAGEVPRNGATQVTMTVSYTAGELVHYLDRAAGPATEIPFAMETLIRDMTRKVGSGILPLHQGIDAALEHAALIGRDWPVLFAGVPRSFQGPPLAHLFHCLVAEGVLRAQSASDDARALFASATASSLLAVGEGALAEAALARAEDSLAAAEPGRARDLASSAVADVRADLLEFLGRYDESAVIRRQQQLTLSDADRDDPLARAARIAIASQQALGLYKQGCMGAAIEAFLGCIAQREALNEELSARASADTSGDVRAAIHGLSGDYANLAAIFTSLADDLVVAQIAAMPGLADEERRVRLLDAHPDPAGAMKRIEEAFPSLERSFGDEIDRGRLLDAADTLLRQALEMSERVEGWEFAGVQAHRLAALHDRLGDSDAAAAFAERAIRHAARAGDHERIASAHALFVDRALAAGDGPTAMAHCEAAARERIRQDVGLGHHTELDRATEAFGDAAFRAAEMGGDALRAVMVVESMRAAHTAASIVTGTPMQPASGEMPESLARLTSQREALRLRLTWDPNDAEGQARLAALEAELADERERVSLRDPRYGRWVDATDVDIAPPAALARRLAQLGANAFWLGGLLVGDRLWSYAAGADGAAVKATAFPRDALAGLAGEGFSAARWTAPVLASLADAILGPHRARLDRATPDDTIVISVAGPLHAVPFAALPWNGRPLCRSVTPIVVQGFGMLEAAFARPRLRLESFALVGSPKRPDLDSLPGAAAEIGAIAAVLTAAGRAVDVLRGPRATVAALAKAASARDAVHIACHAAADPSPERASRLMLSPDLRGGDSGDLSEDRIVSAIEVRPGGLVNLSGCVTGRTRESHAPLLGGLVPAFLLAGAGTVIASLWPIADEPAAAFQAEFYRQLVAGARPAAALAAAQRRAICGELGAEARDMAVWAAHAAYGAG